MGIKIFKVQYDKLRLILCDCRDHGSIHIQNTRFECVQTEFSNSALFFFLFFKEALALVCVRVYEC